MYVLISPAVPHGSSGGISLDLPHTHTHCTETAVNIIQSSVDTHTHTHCGRGSEMPGEFTLFTAVEGRVVEEGAGGAAPLDAVVLLMLRHEPGAAADL